MRPHGSSPRVILWLSAGDGTSLLRCSWNITLWTTLVQVAQELGASPAAIALRWLQYQYRQVIPILGARKLDQLKDNLTCVQFELNDSQLQRLNDASKFELGFPYNMLWDKENVHNIDDLVNGVFKADILK
jgi:diketogulonate reductase-like aldo/keto reductase